MFFYTTCYVFFCDRRKSNIIIKHTLAAFNTKEAFVIILPKNRIDSDID